MIYGTKLKLIRDRNDIKEKDIINILNISKSLYSEYEKEIKTMPVKYLNIVCNYLNVSFDFIFELNSLPQYHNILSKKLDKHLVGLRIKEFRKENKLTQKELGDIAGCEYGTISGYETGRYFISTPALYRICKKYHISADYLLGRIDEPKYLK